MLSKVRQRQWEKFSSAHSAVEVASGKREAALTLISTVFLSLRARICSYLFKCKHLSVSFHSVNNKTFISTKTF